MIPIGVVHIRICQKTGNNIQIIWHITSRPRTTLRFADSRPFKPQDHAMAIIQHSATLCSDGLRSAGPYHECLNARRHFSERSWSWEKEQPGAEVMRVGISCCSTGEKRPIFLSYWTQMLTARASGREIDELPRSQSTALRIVANVLDEACSVLEQRQCHDIHAGMSNGESLIPREPPYWAPPSDHLGASWSQDASLASNLEELMKLDQYALPGDRPR